MKKFLTFTFLVALLAILLTTKGFTQLPPTFWANSFYMETYQSGIGFGSGLILDGRNEPLKFNEKNVDTINKDIFFQEDFEGPSVSFTCGANLVASDDSSAPLNESTSKVVTQSTGALGNSCDSENIALSEKQKGTLLSACTTGKGENFDLVAYDVTNSSELARARFTGINESVCVVFNTLATTDNLQYRIESAIEVDTTEVKFDDVIFKTNPLEPTDIYASTEWKSYSLTIGAVTTAPTKGTIVRDEARWRQVGDSMEIRYDYEQSSAGSNGSGEYLFPLPNNYQIDTAKLSVTTNSEIMVGTGWVSNTATASADATRICTVIPHNASNLKLNCKPANDSASPLGSSFIPLGGTSSVVYTFKATIPIQGWSNTSQGVVVKNRTDSASVENVFSANIAADGTVTSENVDFLDGDCTKGSAGLYNCTFVPGLFSTAPTIVVSSGEDFRNASVSSNPTTTDFSIQVRVPSTAVEAAIPVFITAVRQGTDYIKETDKVFTVPIGFKESEFYRSVGTANFWDSTGAVSTWDVSKIDVTGSETIEIVDNFTTPFTTATVIRAKQDIDITIGFYGDAVAGNGVLIYSDESPTSSDFVSINGGISRTFGTANITTKLRKGEYLFGRIPNATNREGAVQIWAKPSKEEGLWLGTFGQPTCYASRQAAAGIGGGIAITSVWTTLPTWTNFNGSCSFLSHSMGQTILDKGSYDIECHQQFYITSLSKIRLRNTTSSATEIVGHATYADTTSAGETTLGMLSGNLVSNGTDNLELQYYATSGGNGLNLGNGNSDGEPNTFNTCKITKVR